MVKLKLRNSTDEGARQKLQLRVTRATAAWRSREDQVSGQQIESHQKGTKDNNGTAEKVRQRLKASRRDSDVASEKPKVTGW